MRNSNTLVHSLIALGFIFSSAAVTVAFADSCGQGATGHVNKTSAESVSLDKMDIVDTAIAAGQFNTLVAAIKEAGLVSVLKGPGPFTVFAPTDEAFSRLPEGALESLLADREKLTAVLTYHVVPGRVLAGDVVKLDQAKTVQGQSLSINTENGVNVDNAKVVKTDIEASNGVIHVIDTVMMPRDIVDTVVSAGDLTTLATAVQAAGLVETLRGPGPFTIFAPTNAAFAKLPDGALEQLLADKEKLTAVLTAHVLANEVLAADVATLTDATTVQGYSVTIEAQDGVTIDGARVLRTDILATNGVIHLIDSVILPQM